MSAASLMLLFSITTSPEAQSVSITASQDAMQQASTLDAKTKKADDADKAEDKKADEKADKKKEKPKFKEYADVVKKDAITKKAN